MREVGTTPTEIVMSEPVQGSGDEAVRHRIREFILSRFPLARQHPPADDDSLLDLGLVDSLGVLELVEFVSDSFGITVSDEDLNPDNFGSIASLAIFVERKAG